MIMFLAALTATQPIVQPVQPLAFIDRVALHAMVKAEAAQATRFAGRRARAMAALCRSVDAAPARSDFARSLSMAGPEVSILKSACAGRSAPDALLQTAGLVR